MMLSGYTLGLAYVTTVAVRPMLTMKRIQMVVADHYGIPELEMTSNRRSRDVAWPRQMAMYLCRELTKHSLPEIGRRFGKRDHTTVMHAIKAVEARIDTIAEITEDVIALRERLTA